MKWLSIRVFNSCGSLQCQSFLFPHYPSLPHISSLRPVVRFLPRGPDETGCEDRWGILSQSQVPDPTGASALSELLLCTSWLNRQPPHRCSYIISMCLALDLLCWDADWFPQGVCDLAQRSNRQLLRGVWTQVCIMQWWLKWLSVALNGIM